MILSKSYRIKKGDKIPLYGLKKAMIRANTGFILFKIGDSIYTIASPQFVWEFPIIDGKSPKFGEIFDLTDTTSLIVTIFELGEVPSDDYGKEVD